MESDRTRPSPRPGQAAGPRRLAPGLALLLLILACGGGREAAREAIRGLVEREVRAVNDGDLGELARIWSRGDDILLFDVSPPGRFQGWDRIARAYRNFFDNLSEIDLSIDALRVEVEGELGYATYEWSIRARMGEREVVDRGRATSIYRLEKEGWRLVHAHYSPAPPAPAPEDGASAGGPEAGGTEGTGGD
ncbi:MAG: YybH family protein [Acidobacteriota bacterium]